MATKKPLPDQVIVITGASSGIGRATALRAARAGARVVLTARNADALRDLQGVIAASRRGAGRVIAVPGDVGKHEDVERVGAEAIDAFGTIDTWVNDAGVTLYGKLDEVSEADHRRLFDTNFWGLVNGSLVARRHMLDAGGTIINVGSILSDFAVPIQGMYAASKHAIKGFTDALRMEIEGDGLPIAVTLIKPAAIASPLIDHVANTTGRRAKLPPPLYAPEEVARAICHAAVYPRRDITIGGVGRLVSIVAVHAPHLNDALAGQFGPDLQLGGPEENRSGNLDAPGRASGVKGAGQRGRPSLYTRASLSLPGLADLLGAATTAAVSAARELSRKPPGRS